jgi:tripartite-type tricarboxylate transporter receptor subunit TctC
MKTLPIAAKRRSLIKAAAAASVASAATSLLPGIARAQAFPSKPLRLVVPFPAGGSADVMTRLFAAVATQRLGQQVLVENRAGAGGNIAAEYVAKGPADGYTLLLAGQAILAINPVLYPKIGYDPAKDLAFVSMLSSSANVLLVNPSQVPVKNMAEFVALARAKPGSISYGSNGSGSLTHLTTEVFANAAGAKFLHVPYKGAAPLMVDLMGATLGFTFTATPVAVPLVREGKLRALAVTTRGRNPQLPDVPTLVESGFPALDLPTWFGFLAPSGTPAPVLAVLRKEFAEVLASREYGEALAKNASELMPVGPDAADAFLANERRLWASAVRASGAKVD